MIKIISALRALRISQILGLTLIALYALPAIPAGAGSGTCYGSTGSNTVEATSFTCTIDPSGRKTYKNAAGTVIAAPESDKCYLGVTSGSGSFSSITFTEGSCSDLEAKRIQAESTFVPTNSNTNGGGDIAVDGAGDDIFALIQTGINLLYAMIAFVVIAMIIVGGIQYSTAGGNPQAAGEAKKKINNAILALVVLAFLYPFLQWLVPGGIF